jgi:hypothetical protein
MMTNSNKALLAACAAALFAGGVGLSASADSAASWPVGGSQAEWSGESQAQSSSQTQAGTRNQQQAQTSNQRWPSVVSPAPKVADQSPKPQKSENTRLKIVAVTSPARPGEEVIVEAQAAPNAACTLVIGNASAVEKGDLQQVASGEGKVSFKFTVAENFHGNQLPIEINSVLGDKHDDVRVSVPVLSISSNPKNKGL